MWVQQGHILSPYLFNLYAKYIMQKARLDESQAGIKIVKEKYQPQICRSVQFSHSVTSISWWPHGLQHARPPYPSPTPGVYSNSCPLSQWCPSNHLILCRPLLLPPSVFLTIRVFSNESVLCIRWQKYWSFNFNISPSNEHSGLVSFRMEWLDLLAVEGTLKSLLHHHSSKHQFFCSQLSLWSNSHIYTRLLEKP